MVPYGISGIMTWFHRCGKFGAYNATAEISQLSDSRSSMP